MKNYKKGVYTLAEIGETVYKKCPGRFKNTESASAMARKVARRLGIGDINGKKRFRYITANDAARIVEAIQRTPSRKRRAEQVSLFDDGIVDWIEPYTFRPAPEKPHTTEDPELTPEQIAGRIERLTEEVNDLIKALLNTIKTEG